MKVIIVGAGEVGYHIADRLSRERHDVVLIERNAEKIGLLASKLNALVVEGIGASAALTTRPAFGIRDEISVGDIAGIYNREKNVLGMMPHPERVFRTVQHSWHPDDWGPDGPWLRLFRNARTWAG